jgi:predicted enzyme related to lactoylglutathione lyase
MGKVVHFEIPADDLDCAERFYTTVFGWKCRTSALRTTAAVHRRSG